MKKLFLAVLAFAAFGAMSSCSSSKSAQVANPAGMVEEVVPLSGAAYHSNAEYYRAVQNGVSSDRSMAQKKAMQNCRQELASNLQADLELVIENYAKSQNTQFGEDLKTHYQELSYAVVNQRLVDVQVVEEKCFKEESGNYRFYVCLQLPKQSIQDAMISSLENDEKLNLEFDLAMFKKVFEEQMANFQK
jgi:hypothetical protein